MFNVIDRSDFSFLLQFLYIGFSRDGYESIPDSRATYSTAAQLKSWFPSRRLSKFDEHMLTNRTVDWMALDDNDDRFGCIPTGKLFVHLSTRHRPKTNMTATGKSIRLLYSIAEVPLRAAMTIRTPNSLQGSTEGWLLTTIFYYSCYGCCDLG